MRRFARRAPARDGAIAFGLVLLAGLVALGLPWLTQERTWVTSTPAPAALQRLVSVPIPVGGVACIAPAVFETRTARATVIADVPGGARGPALRVRATGPGYASTATVAGGYPSHATLVADLEPPRTTVSGRLCLRNRGPGRVAIEGTIEPRRASTLVNGRQAMLTLAKDHTFRATMAVTLSEAQPHPLQSRIGVVLRHLTAFRPGVVTPVTLGLALLVLLALLGAALPWAWARAVRQDAPRAPRRSEGRRGANPPTG